MPMSKPESRKLLPATPWDIPPPYPRARAGGMQGPYTLGHKGIRPRARTLPSDEFKYSIRLMLWLLS